MAAHAGNHKGLRSPAPQYLPHGADELLEPGDAPAAHRDGDALSVQAAMGQKIRQLTAHRLLGTRQTISGKGLAHGNQRRQGQVRGKGDLQMGGRVLVQHADTPWCIKKWQAFMGRRFWLIFSIKPHHVV